MATADRLRLLLPPQLRALPADLAATLVYVVAVNLAVFLPGLNETPLRVVLGLPLVLFVPGYVFIAALFPEAGESPAADGDGESPAADGADGSPDAGGVDDAGEAGGSGWRSDRGIDGIERVALSFGLSIAIVPLIGLGLNFTPWGIRLVPIMVSLSVFVLGTTAVATRRRWALSAEDRFRVPYRSWLAAARAELFEPDSRADLALNVLLVASVLLAVGSVGYAVTVPKQGESFTELYLLTENDDGDLMADGYPTNLTAGENASLVVGVGNHEHEPTSYEVVVELQRVEVRNNSTRVRERRELDRFGTPELEHNETWQRTRTVTPTMAGDRLRLQFLLFRGGAPANPAIDEAYRVTHLWVNVSSR